MAVSQVLKDEIKKCAKDPIYFIYNYVKISHIKHGLIPFKLYDYQKKIIKAVLEHRFVIVLKGRQLGISTLTSAYCLWCLMFKNEQTVVALATKQKTASELVRKVSAMFGNLPEFLKSNYTASIDNQIEFRLKQTNSAIKAFATTGTSGRGEAGSLLVLDEAAHIEGLDDVWTSVYPSLATGGNCIALSTPCGVGNWFERTYKKAEKGGKDNQFYPIKLPWNVNPTFDQAWYEDQVKNCSKRQIAQEYECSFLASGMTLIDPEDLIYIEENTLETPTGLSGPEKEIWTWREFEPGHEYLMAIDTARGDAEDLSASEIIDMTTREQVCEFLGRKTVDYFARICYEMGSRYGFPIAVPENSGIGFALCKELVEIEYPSIFYSDRGTHDYVDQYEAATRTDVIAGVTMSVKTRPWIINNFEVYVRSRNVIIHSKRLYDELQKFIWNGDKAEASKGSHDDLTMATAIGCWVMQNHLRLNLKDYEMAKSLIKSIKQVNTLYDNLTDKVEGYNEETLGIVYSRGYKAETMKQFKLAKKYSWLMD